MPSDFFEKNLSILSSRFPVLSEKVKALDFSKIGISNSADGGMCYAAMNERNEWIPVSNYENPIKAAQASLDKMQHRLTGGLCPAVIVGLYPGYILESVFRYFQSRLNHNEPFRHIYIVIDSVHCFAGWLKASDRTAILEQEEVSFHWYENIREITELCEGDYQRSHLFIPLSILPENELNKIIAPLAELYLRRKKEEQLWLKENEDYYTALTDEKLTEIISGKSGRKPRLLMPTHMSSTVVQYSTRDTCKAFEQMGWETMILKMERDLSPWLMIKTIHDFKPDVFIFINHLRIEHENITMYPGNMMFLTWIQDAMVSINNSVMGLKWNSAVSLRKRDLLIGYIEQLYPYDYFADRQVSLGMIVNADIFKPHELTEDDKEKYACDVCFASNRGKTSELVIEEELFPSLSIYGFSRDVLYQINDYLWDKYRSGKTFTTYVELRNALSSVIEFDEIYSRIPVDKKDNVIQKIFWQLNDLIYRHIILEWLDEAGDMKLNIYGKGWEAHPKFKKYAKGVIEHGENLSKAYQSAKYCLHLNSNEGAHQRPLEILASGGNVIARKTDSVKDTNYFLLSALIKSAQSYADDNSAVTFDADEQSEFNSYTFLEAIQILNRDPDIGINGLKKELGKIHILDEILDASKFAFRSKDELQKILGSSEKKNNVGAIVMKLSNKQLVVDIIEKILTFINGGKNYVDPAKDYSDFDVNLLQTALCLVHSDIAMGLEFYKKIKHPGTSTRLYLVKRLLKSKKESYALQIYNSINYSEISDIDQKADYLVIRGCIEIEEQIKRGQKTPGISGYVENEIEKIYACNSQVKDIYSRIAEFSFMPCGRYLQTLEYSVRDYDSEHISSTAKEMMANAFAMNGELKKAMNLLDETISNDSDVIKCVNLLKIISDEGKLFVEHIMSYFKDENNPKNILRWLIAVCKELLVSPSEIIGIYNTIAVKNNSIVYETAEALAVRGDRENTSKVLSDLRCDECLDFDFRKYKIEYLSGHLSSGEILEAFAAYYESDRNVSGLFKRFAGEVFIPLFDYRNTIIFLEKELYFQRGIYEDIYLLAARAYADIDDPVNAWEYIRKAPSWDTKTVLEICDAFIHFDRLSYAREILEMPDKSKFSAAETAAACCYYYEAGLVEESDSIFSSSPVLVQIMISEKFFNRNHVNEASQRFLKIKRDSLKRNKDKTAYLMALNSIYDEQIMKELSEEFKKLYQELLESENDNLIIHQQYIKYLGCIGDFESAENYAEKLGRESGIRKNIYVYIASALTPRITDHYDMLSSARDSDSGTSDIHLTEYTKQMMRQVVCYMTKDTNLSAVYNFIIAHFKFLFDRDSSDYVRILKNIGGFSSFDSWGVVWYIIDMALTGHLSETGDSYKRINKIIALNSSCFSEYFVTLYYLKTCDESLSAEEKEYFLDFVRRKVPRFSEYGWTLEIIKKISGAAAADEYKRFYNPEKCIGTQYAACILRFYGMDKLNRCVMKRY